MRFEFYLVFKKNKRGSSTTSFARKPTIKADEVSMKMNINVPDEMFVKPTLECKIDLPSHRVNDIEVNKKEIEEAMSRITGAKINMTVTEIMV